MDAGFGCHGGLLVVGDATASRYLKQSPPAYQAATVAGDYGVGGREERFNTSGICPGLAAPGGMTAPW